MTYTLCELQRKEVIDLCSGARMGFPDDVIIDECGNVLSLSIPPSGFKFPFSHCDPKLIPWCHIERITEETIWVKPVRE